MLRRGGCGQRLPQLRQDKFVEQRGTPAHRRIVAALHLLHGAKEAGLALVQKDDAVGQLPGEAHVVGDDDAGEVQLGLEALR